MSWSLVTNTSYGIFLTKIILDYETNYSCIAHNDELAIIITNNHAKFGYTKIITEHQFTVVIITTIIILNETRFYWHILKSKYALSMAKYIYMYSQSQTENCVLLVSLISFFCCNNLSKGLEIKKRIVYNDYRISCGFPL